jgi:hypothetical protein
MNAPLRVDPAQLQAAAAAESDVADGVAGLAPGAALKAAGLGVAGLTSAEACEIFGAAVETALTGVHEELAAHSSNVAKAADRYHRVDGELGQRLRRIAE